jgi:hypothetical protein
LVAVKLSAAILSIFILMVSCENPLDNNNDLPAELITSTLDMFDGEVLVAESDKIDDVSVWKIKVQNQAAAVTSFYWRRPFNNLFRIYGEAGPFDYNLKPPFDVINFKTAKFLAVTQNQQNMLESWEFSNNPTEMRWYYKFYLRDSSFPILVDAGSGEIVR